MTNFFLLNQIILNNKREDGSQSPYWDSLSVKVNLIIRMEIRGLWRQRSRMFMTTGQLSKSAFLSEESSLCGIRFPKHEAECVIKSDLLGSQQK